MTDETKPKLKPFTYRLPVELGAELKKLCTITDKDPSTFVGDLIENAIEDLKDEAREVLG
jgi:predicted DNA-binding protein